MKVVVESKATIYSRIRAVCFPTVTRRACTGLHTQNCLCLRSPSRPIPFHLPPLALWPVACGRLRCLHSPARQNLWDVGSAKAQPVWISSSNPIKRASVVLVRASTASTSASSVLRPCGPHAGLLGRLAARWAVHEFGACASLGCIRSGGVYRPPALGALHFASYSSEERADY